MKAANLIVAQNPLLVALHVEVEMQPNTAPTDVPTVNEIVEYGGVLHMVTERRPNQKKFTCVPVRSTPIVPVKVVETWVA